MNGILPKCSHSDHCCWKEYRFDCPARIVRAARSAHGIPCSMMQTRVNLTCRSCTWPKSRRASAFTTARSQKLLCLDLITATRWTIQKCCAYGKRNSAILPMLRKRSLISSSSQQNRNGNSQVGSCFCSRMATKARGRSTPVLDWSAFCRPAPKITSKSAISLLPHSIFMCCGAR